VARSPDGLELGLALGCSGRSGTWVPARSLGLELGFQLGRSDGLELGFMLGAPTDGNLDCSPVPPIDWNLGLH
jgi:hypothetical protein